ncbi:MAG: hypothetical protein HY926_10970 [Elusimicrobia bacterium]|nr:hypothetical protein [Elusimicrobiota bacterium]
MDWRTPAAFLALTALTGCAKHYVYQNTAWDMDEKKFTIARPLSRVLPGGSGDRFWSEPTVIDSLKATATYRLGPEGLQSVTVVFEPVQTGKELYLDHYRRVKVLLSEKYGAPEVEGADLAVRVQKLRSFQVPEHQTRSVFRSPLARIELTCGGECDGTSVGNSIMITYEKPRPRTEGL